MFNLNKQIEIPKVSSYFLCYLQVILAEDNEIRDKLAEHDLHVQTISEVAPIEVKVTYFITFSIHLAMWKTLEKLYTLKLIIQFY